MEETSLAMWEWVKIKPPGDRRFSSLFPLTRVPFGVPMFDPQPCVCRGYPFYLSSHGDQQGSRIRNGWVPLYDSATSRVQWQWVEFLWFSPVSWFPNRQTVRLVVWIWKFQPIGSSTNGFETMPNHGQITNPN